MFVAAPHTDAVTIALLKHTCLLLLMPVMKQ